MAIEKIATVAGSRTHYWTYHPSKKPIIVMIHGFRGTHHGLELIAAQLPNYRVIIPDLPAFGKSSPLAQHTIDSYGHWLADFLALQSQPVVLLGHSFGSIICAQLASHHPQLKALILVNPIGDSALAGPHKILTKAAIFYYWLGKKLPETAAKTWLSWKPIVYVMSRLMAKTNDRTLNHYIDQQHFTHFSQFNSASSLLETFQASASHSVKEYAPSISTKTLLIAGEKDDITPLKKQQSLQKMFSHAQLVTVPKVGHLTHYEAPQQVAQAVRTFVKSV